MLSDALEIVGLGLVVAGVGLLFGVAVGVVAAGAALVLIGFGLDR